MKKQLALLIALSTSAASSLQCANIVPEDNNQHAVATKFAEKLANESPEEMALDILAIEYLMIHSFWANLGFNEIITEALTSDRLIRFEFCSVIKNKASSYTIESAIGGINEDDKASDDEKQHRTTIVQTLIPVLEKRIIALREKWSVMENWPEIKEASEIEYTPLEQGKKIHSLAHKLQLTRSLETGFKAFDELCRCTKNSTWKQLSDEEKQEKFKKFWNIKR